MTESDGAKGNISLNDELLQDNVQNRVTQAAKGEFKDTTAVQQLLQNVHLGTQDVTQKKTAVLRAKAYALLAQLNFEDAAKPLDEISSLSPLDVDTNLLCIECFLQLGREGKAIKAIDAINKALLTSPNPDVAEVWSLANIFIDNSRFIRAIVLLRVAASMYSQSEATDDSKLISIYNCASKTHDAVGAMVRAGDRLRTIAIDYGIEYLAQMLELLRSLRGAHVEKKALMEAWCVNWLGYNQCLVDEKEKSIFTRTTGIVALEDRFGENAKKYRIYGIMLHNIGVAYFNSNNFSEAEIYYSKAIEAKTNALDYDSDKQRAEDVDLSEAGMLNTLQKLP